MWYTYILTSLAAPRTYVGHTNDLQRRLKEHNDGTVISSRSYRPYKFLRWWPFESLKEAKERELYYKSSLGRYHLRKNFEIWSALTNIDLDLLVNAQNN